MGNWHIKYIIGFFSNLFILTIVVPLSIASEGMNSNSCSPLIITQRVEEMKIVLILKNISNKPVKINGLDTPKFSANIELQAFIIKSKKGQLQEVRRAWWLDDPVETLDFTIEPGQTHQSTLDPKEHFPHLEENLGTNNALIMWQYNVPLCEEDDKLASGWFII